MKKINALYCLEYLSLGGTEKQLISLINGLNRAKFQPHLCCLRNSIIGKSRRSEALDLFKSIDCPKIQLDFISFRNIQSVIELIKLIKFIRKYKIDIVQTYFQDPSVFGLVAGKLAGVKNIIACFRDMGFWQEQEYYWKMKMVYKFCSAYVANSLSVKNHYATTYNLSDDKFKVIYNGIDVENFRSITRKAKHDNKNITIGIIANLNREIKRVDIFLKAAAYALQHTNNITFIVAGDGELKANLIELSEKLGINRNVKFLGSVKDIPRLLSRIHIGVISSDSEGFSNAILEYMIAGLPVVATDTGGNREIVKPGVNGYLVPTRDCRAMGDRIIDLVSEDEARLRMGENARRMVLENYSIDKSIKNHERYYESLLKTGLVI
jgi:L-malate glycosyltransferase